VGAWHVAGRTARVVLSRTDEPIRESVAHSTRAWLYVRGDQSVRIVMDGGSLAVYGPGDLFRRHDYHDDAAAVLEHSVHEQQLVRDGWWLERMTTERRSGSDRRKTARTDRRRGLRLVSQQS
jgi:hypothetical protein